MPLATRLKLNLNSLQLSTQSAGVNVLPTREHLHSNLDNLKAKIRDEPTPGFQKNWQAPNYSAMGQSGYDTRHSGFILSNSGLDAFMHARREQGQCAGTFDEDKFHISAKPEDVPRAFDALSGLLFSEDCPVDKWKVTEMQRVDSGQRISEGAQFTLYVKPDGANSQYSAQGLNRIRHFVQQLELALSEHNIQPGQFPDSDVRPNHWQFTSYRNELRSQREGSEAQSSLLRNEPFYRLLSE